MMKNVLYIGICLPLLFTSCGENKTKEFAPEEHLAMVKQLDSIYSHHIEKQMTDSLENVFLSDAILLPEGEDEIKGINAIKEWYKNAYEYGLKTIVDSTTSLSGDENNIVEIGKSTVGLMIGDADTMSYETHKYVQVWHKQANGKYKISRQMWNN